CPPPVPRLFPYTTLFRSPASRHVSYVRDINTVSFGVITLLAAVSLLVVAWSNAVKITDGLDGLAAGSMSLALGAYVIITVWQYRSEERRVGIGGGAGRAW